MGKHKFPYRWNLSDGYPAKGIDANNLNVFGTFICGGGSTMGYKLAGFNHLGGVDIDKKMAEVYRVNHKPKYLYNEDIRLFNERTDLPDELYSLDVLDGSPPCSTFSMAGSREGAWGKEKIFREGQEKQTLDDLVFVYCKTIKKLRPKVFILENVKGIIQGNAKAYSRKIAETMSEAGYIVQVFCLDASTMGVPQRRERVFFVGRCKDLMGGLPNLVLNFDEEGIVFRDVKEAQIKRIPTKGNVCRKLWDSRIPSDTCIGDISKRSGKVMGFSIMLARNQDVFPTVVSNSSYYLHDDFTLVSDGEYKSIGTFPQDYSFNGQSPKYIIGMSVPPVMTAQIAHQTYLQWFRKL